MHSLQLIIIIVSFLMLLCVFASKFSTRLGVPILIFFIISGMLLGSEGLFGIYFDNAFLTKEIGDIALCFIIFAGGMDLRWRAAKPIIKTGLALSTISVLLTALLVGVFTKLLLGFPLSYGFLLGAIVSPTDAASVFSTLRSQKFQLKESIVPLLEFESGSNDTMAYMLTIMILGFIKNPQNSITGYIIIFIEQFSFGIIIGVALGFGTVWLLNRIHLNIESMYIIVGLALMTITYSICSLIGGNSFLAVYIAGLIIGNSSFIRKTRFIRFFDIQSWLAQIVLFITLGLQVFPSRLLSISLDATIISLALIFIIRPVAVIPILTSFKIPFKQQAFISFIGFRGAASIVFATYPLIAGLPIAQNIFDIVFFIALFSIVIQGTALKTVAKRLEVIQESNSQFIMQNFNNYADEIDMPVLGVYVPVSSPAIGKSVIELNLPEDIRIVAIRQTENYSIPKGSTIIKPGNKMLLTSLNEDSLSKICKKYEFES